VAASLFSQSQFKEVNKVCPRPLKKCQKIQTLKKPSNHTAFHT